MHDHAPWIVSGCGDVAFISEVKDIIDIDIT